MELNVLHFLSIIPLFIPITYTIFPSNHLVTDTKLYERVL